MAAQPPKKRGPLSLVTDSREAQFARPARSFGLQRPNTNTRLISVDNVLQYASEIPSGQRRGPPRPAPTARSLSGRNATDPRMTGRMVQQQLPLRSSKVSEKLVLLPETDIADEDEKVEFGDEDDEVAPPRDEDVEERRRPTAMRGKSYAERLPKASRTEKVSRVTAYCTAQAYKMRATADFVRTKHDAKTKLYDDCLYTVYHLPLLPGNEGYRIRSSPILKSPGGKSVLDEAIERNERYEYREGFFGEETYDLDGGHDSRQKRESMDSNGSATPPETAGEPYPSPPPPSKLLANSLSHFAEMFTFSYGVVVFWNFTERQEKDILADLTFSSSSSTSWDGIPLAVRPQSEEDFETEEFHFEYNPEIPRPRVFNDMITLRTGDHMIKLSMSHAIAQSTKLSYFEERMAESMDEAQYVPRRLALTGDLGLKREEVVRILGKLFKSRVEVNLSSNMLDVPKFFWDSEPTLHPLYSAVREYLEIKPRIQVLNERCRVFLDLAEILSDSISDKKMARLTWIIIVLIVLSILVTGSEVFLRFGIVSSSTHGKDGDDKSGAKNGTATALARFVESGIRYAAASRSTDAGGRVITDL